MNVYNERGKLIAVTCSERPAPAEKSFINERGKLIAVVHEKEKTPCSPKSS